MLRLWFGLTNLGAWNSVGGAPPLLQPGNVFAPTARPVQQTIDVTSDRLVRKAKVQDALYDKIDFFYSQVDQYHLANIDAVVSVGGGDDMNVDTDESVPSLDVPPESIGVGSVRPVTMVGDFKLCVAADKPRSRPAAEIAEVFGRCRRVELAKQLVAAGLECSFDTSSGGGVLKCCGGKVLVQKVNHRAAA